MRNSIDVLPSPSHQTRPLNASASAHQKTVQLADSRKRRLVGVRDETRTGRAPAASAVPAQNATHSQIGTTSGGTAAELAALAANNSTAMFLVFLVRRASRARRSGCAMIGIAESYSNRARPGDRQPREFRGTPWHPPRSSSLALCRRHCGSRRGWGRDRLMGFQAMSASGRMTEMSRGIDARRGLLAALIGIALAVTAGRIAVGQLPPLSDPRATDRFLRGRRAAEPRALRPRGR